MKTLKVLAVLSIAASSLFAAQEPGFFVGAGVGKAQLKNATITKYNPLASPSPEALPSRNNTNNVSVAAATVGYVFNSDWDLRLTYTGFGEAEINFPGPRYPGIFFATTPDEIVRDAVIYRTNMVTLLPVYTISVNDRFRVSGGVGVNYATVGWHSETTVHSFIPNMYISNRSADKTEHNWTVAVQLGAEYYLLRQLSLGVTGNYSEAKAKLGSNNLNIKATSLQFAAKWYF
ncbi:MAG: outer membrane beta-barrel protein [Nibricoccus sp.]